MTEVVEQMSQLKQGSTVISYQERFEEIKLKLEKLHPELTEAYYTKCFIAGLKPELRSTVRAQEPGDIYTAIKQAKYQEVLMKEILEAVKAKTTCKPLIPIKLGPQTPHQNLHSPPAKMPNHLNLNQSTKITLPTPKETQGNAGSVERNRSRGTNATLPLRNLWLLPQRMK